MSDFEGEFLMNKKILLPIIFVTSVFLLLSCLGFAEALLTEKPSAQIEKVDIESISLESISFLFDVRIANPYPVSINLAGVNSKFSVESNQLFETSTTKPFSVAARGSSVNTILVNLRYADIVKIVNDYVNKDKLNCDIDGSIVLDIPDTGIPGIPDTYTFPFKTSKTIPTFKPTLSVKDFTLIRPSTEEIKTALLKSGSKLNIFDVIKVLDKLVAGRYDEAFSVIDPKDLDLKFGVNFKILLKNETKSMINFNSFKYDFLMNGDPLITGATTSDIKAVDNVVTLNVANTVSLVSFSRSIVRALQTNKADFKLSGETEVKFPDEIKKEPLKLKIDSAGNLGIVTK